MVICNFRERYFFITFAPLSIIFVLVLSKLTATVCAKTVQMTTICESHSVSLTARYCDYLLVVESLYSSWIGLIRLVLCIFRQIPDVIQS